MNPHQIREEKARKAVREHLSHLFPTQYIFDTTNYNDPYDMFFFTFNTDQSIKSRIIIENKIRDKSYNTYIIERRKVYEILNKIEEYNEKVEFLYINFCPEGTYIWKATDLINNYWEQEWVNNPFNKETERSRDDKKMKDVIYLHTEEAYFVEFKINDMK